MNVHVSPIKRPTFFSNAAFAISITLAIEIEVPRLGKGGNQSYLQVAGGAVARLTRGKWAAQYT